MKKLYTHTPPFFINSLQPNTTDYRTNPPPTQSIQFNSCTDKNVTNTGYFAASTGTSACDSCIPGQITASSGDYAGKSACHNCPAGYFVSGHGQSTCGACPAGQYSAAGVSTCTSCAAGKKANAARNGCEDCVAGEYENNNVCIGCPIGYSQITAAQTSCSICPAGKKRASGDAASAACPPCNTGTHQNEPGQSTCKNCDAGYYAATAGSIVNCENCLPGKYSTATLSACIDCEAGKSSAAVHQPSACNDCDTGKFQDITAQTTCKVCGVGSSTVNAPLQYNSAEGQISCLTCGTNKIANAAKDGCDNCAASLLAPDVYFDTNTNQCEYCNGCPEGQTKLSCAVASCSVCLVGQYKLESQVGVNTNVLKGVGWNTGCTECPPCDAGKYRAGGLCIAGGGALSAEASQCASCPGGKFKTGLGEYNDVCDDCVACNVGATRTNCGLATDGACTGWATPTVTSVSGTGQENGGTPGNEILDIFGKYYGPKRAGTAATDVVVRYGPPSAAPSTWYTALSCSVEAADEPLLSESNSLNQGQIRC